MFHHLLRLADGGCLSRHIGGNLELDGSPLQRLGAFRYAFFQFANQTIQLRGHGIKRTRQRSQLVIRLDRRLAKEGDFAGAGLRRGIHRGSNFGGYFGECLNGANALADG